jgi:hypothetical protein
MGTLSQYEIEQLAAATRYKYLTQEFVTPGAVINIAHGLKRTPKRWVVVGIDAAAIVYGTTDEVYLNLAASAACNVTLEVI